MSKSFIKSLQFGLFSVWLAFQFPKLSLLVCNKYIINQRLAIINCKNNNITNIEDPANIEFVDKDYFIKKGEKTYPVDFDDFNFRISYQVEKKYNISHKNIEDLLSKWNTTKKIGKLQYPRQQ